jgi:hypothetical protein
MPRRMWTEDERAIVKRDYGRQTAAEIARKLGRSARAVYLQAEKQGLAKIHRTKTDEVFIAELRQLHSLGYPDAEIAKVIGCERHTIARWRKGFGLSPNTYSDRRRTQVRAKTAEQLQKANLPTLAMVRAKAFRDYAIASGWPEDLPPRCVQILEALSRLGPLTREEIAPAIGLPWIGSRASLKSRGGRGSYLADLMARGFVVSLGRIAGGRGKGGNRNLYTLGLAVEKQIQREDS